MTETDPISIEWARKHFDAMADEATWSVRRCGLIFKKQGDTLYLMARMAHNPNVPGTAEELDAQQRTEFTTIRDHFEAAGVKVVWNVPGEEPPRP